MQVLFYLFLAAVLVGAVHALALDLTRGTVLGWRDDDTDVVELPLPAGWTEADVLITYAEIQAL